MEGRLLMVEGKPLMGEVRLAMVEAATHSSQAIDGRGQVIDGEAPPIVATPSMGEGKSLIGEAHTHRLTARVNPTIYASGLHLREAGMILVVVQGVAVNFVIVPIRWAMLRPFSGVGCL